ncbi:hypothetical protein CDAR_42231 [Caerostris darwini]|uniref:Uncharacterized protein n=1 Tax=Caerostris darwini TaxID=1538125 RepID=A0AAV4RL53_9ARAC|nr:hypothetical protein CDAR_42231 [Caerostris darwini]
MTPARAIPTRNSSTLMPISGKDYRVARWALKLPSQRRKEDSGFAIMGLNSHGKEGWDGGRTLHAAAPTPPPPPFSGFESWEG